MKHKINNVIYLYDQGRGAAVLITQQSLVDEGLGTARLGVPRNLVRQGFGEGYSDLRGGQRQWSGATQTLVRKTA